MVLHLLESQLLGWITSDMRLELWKDTLIPWRHDPLHWCPKRFGCGRELCGDGGHELMCSATMEEDLLISRATVRTSNVAQRNNQQSKG